MSEGYDVRFSKAARRALSKQLPEKVAAAAFEFIMGALAGNPKRLGKQLEAPLWPLYSARRGEYRVIYRVEDRHLVVEIVSIAHRWDAHRL
ncbi:type II toxin-antitoxin system RelE family toxin [Subtercola boreus]|uniref:Plasmid stabilization protein n=1 Tax=Subtercola boreus TaxID=120213 RepID=A0A3E0WBG5_9MICO|nr:type II toxin-antitoxin system RelE/ParE family toxin [Subtercola boreus]RFA21765.1 plasmid stabilization protein [Subtercola boreus]RFA21877.1 plasmid stabilization protein [Subtercola boreus]RFA27823.1 plasmid stabilization protein [Subtercola boreus]